MARRYMLLACAVMFLQSALLFAQTTPTKSDQTTSTSALIRPGADALLAIDQHRATVIDRIVSQWGYDLAGSSAKLNADQLRTMLNGLRADELLAASLAGTLDGLRNVLAIAVTSSASSHERLVHTKALGDSALDVVYTPVTPCRLVETRGSFAAVYQGDGSSSHVSVPFVSGETRNYTIQGGNGVCLTQLPAGLTPSAVQIQVFGIPTTAGSGDIEILPQGSSFGSTATMVYIASIAFNTVSTNAKVNLANNQIGVQVRGGGAHVAIDVVGYFRSAGDATALNINVNGQRAMRYEYNLTSPNVIGGSPNNSVSGTFYGQTVAGGGLAGNQCFDPPTGTNTRSCGNRALNAFAAVGGGWANLASNGSSTVAGGSVNTASGGISTVAGGSGNIASGDGSTVAGGISNTASGDQSTVVGGSFSSASGKGATVAGGGGPENTCFNLFTGTFNASCSNGALAQVATVGGGHGNSASNVSSTVAGGEGNVAGGNHSTVAGGFGNYAVNAASTIAGGSVNRAGGAYSAVPGGDNNVANGDYSFAAGRRAKANGNGSFIWADSRDFDFTNTAFFSNVFAARATGGAQFTVGIDASSGNPVWSCTVFNGGSWSCTSDRNAKENFAAVDGKAILDQVAALPLSSWNGKGVDPRDRHLGPMAQDFYSAFGLGLDDTRISSGDLSGVALAAIQGLHQVVQDKEVRIALLEKTVADLKRIVEALVRKE